MNTFEFVGTLSIPKATEKFKPVADYDKSHWKGHKVTFQVKNNENNTQLVEVMGGFNKDGSTVIKTTANEKGDDGKYKKLEIKWADRNKPENIQAVANFRKFVFDMDVEADRWAIQRQIKALEASSTDSDAIVFLQENYGMTEGANALEFAKDLLAKSLAKRKEFLSEYDFVEFLKTAIPKCGNNVFVVTGVIESSIYNGNGSQKFKVQQVKLAAPGTPQKFRGEMEIYFDNSCLDESMFTDIRKYFLNGYVRNYSSAHKKEIGIPTTVVIDGSKFDASNEIATRQLNFLKSLFTVEEKENFSVCGVKCVFANGVQKVEVTEDMLSPFEKEQIFLGLASIEDFKKAYGQANGEREREIKVVGLSTQYLKTGSKETAYTLSDFLLETEESIDDVFNNTTTNSTTGGDTVLELEDLFS